MKLTLSNPKSALIGTLANNSTVCGIFVSNPSHRQSAMEPPVFHMQHSANLHLEGPQAIHQLYKSSKVRLKAFHGAAAVMLTALVPQLALAKENPCIDYYTVGESSCKPKASTPVAKPQVAQPAQTAPQQQPSEVDKYLADYGKPPREFVEFYLNPTPENANKWVSAYQQLLQKGENISKAWGQADELYRARQTGVAPGVAPAKTLSPEMPVQPQPEALFPSPVKLPPQNFGAFGQRPVGSPGRASGIAQTQTSLTYYFSQTCPYCARTTPDLSIISNEKAGKLVFTCVDVTPLSATHKPDEAYITSKLPCKWRLPEEGEVERESVRQTPTLVIRKGDQAPVRLSGYVPLAQLRTYF